MPARRDDDGTSVIQRARVRRLRLKVRSGSDRERTEFVHPDFNAAMNTR